MLSFCGIDVAKERLGVMVLPEQQCSSVRNDPAGWAELVELLRGFLALGLGDYAAFIFLPLPLRHRVDTRRR